MGRPGRIKWQQSFTLYTLCLRDPVSCQSQPPRNIHNSKVWRSKSRVFKFTFFWIPFHTFNIRPESLVVTTSPKACDARDSCKVLPKLLLESFPGWFKGTKILRYLWRVPGYLCQSEILMWNSSSCTQSLPHGGFCFSTYEFVSSWPCSAIISR